MDNMASMSRITIEMNKPEYNLSIVPNIQYDYFYVESFLVPFVWNNFPAHQIVFFDSMNVQHTIDIPGGYYDIGRYLSIITQQFTSLDTGGRSYTYDGYDDKSSYIQISADSFSFTISSNIAQQRSGFIGTLFSIAQRVNSGKYSYEPKLLLWSMNLTIQGQGGYDNIQEALLDQQLNLQARSQFTFVVPLSVLDILNGIVSQEYGSFNTCHPLQGARIGSIHIKVTDEFLQPIEIFPQRMYLTLVFYNNK